MSLPRLRLLATALPLLGALLAFAPAPAAAIAADTWTLLSTAPAGAAGDPVFALAVDPTDTGNVLYGTAAGEIYRSTDAGGSWKRVAAGLGHGVLALAFDPIESGHVLAGTRGAGIWRSDDSGAAWHALDRGTETVRDFAFSVGLSAAATDTGVLVTHDGDTWTAADLQQASVAAVAAGDGKLTAGADLDPGTKGLPLFRSANAGASWNQLSSLSGAGAIVSSLGLTGGKLLVGTNAGLFASPDGGTSWAALSSGALPQTDFTTVATPAGSQVYVASDGGASSSGGVWASGDGAQSFRSLNAPVPSVTALAVAKSTLYAATFRPLDHAVFLWAYVDDGGAPQQPVGAIPSPHPVKLAPATPSGKAASSGQWYLALVRGPELPYLAVGAAALLVLLLALIAYVRRGRV